MIKAVLYIRSSKDRADASPAAQRRALQELARQRHFAIVGEFVDTVVSGKDDDRPGFQSLLRAMRSKDRGWTHILAVDTARIARRRSIAIIFEEQECKRQGVSVVYKSLPEADPAMEMLLKSILQAMDEWHSLTSRAKGVAGMAENVRQGWRAGGRAPKGYVLKYVSTGAVRDGEQVMKSVLTPADDAPAVSQFLKHRSRGIRRGRALALAGLSWPPTTAIEVERNAQLYAGHTTWNRTEERLKDGYAGGRKWRPEEEWVTNRNTHPALITDAEARAILDGLNARRRSGGYPARQIYLFGGMMTAPSGARWSGDSGYYRLGKTSRISAKAVEQAVMGRVIEDFKSERMVDAIINSIRQASVTIDVGQDTSKIERKRVETDRKIARLTELVSETRTPAPLLRQIETLEAEREVILSQIAQAKAPKGPSLDLSHLRPSDIRAMLDDLATELTTSTAPEMRDLVQQVIEKVELCAESFEATIHYRPLPLPGESGVRLASPRGFEPRSAP
ncbi:MAG: hypothetical protein C6Y20_02855 [Tagaea sp. CACIAM 22H2]|nr:hypothetical protein [Tagaea sp. CACIAM 22H2]